MITIKKQWLSGETIGGIECKRVSFAPNGKAIRRSFEKLRLAQEPNAVLHTTEGHWEGSLNVFTTTGTPTFMLGWHTVTLDNKKRSGPFHLAQLCPIGEMALTLVNDAGGTETNREALVQIELIGFSKKEPWLPDAQTTKVLAALMERLEEVCGIPLQRAGNGSRSVALWDGKAGWFGHGEVPENSHWDPGALRWADVFKAAPLDPDVFWEAWSGGVVLNRQRAGGSGEADAYDRLIRWLDDHEIVVRRAEKENGQVKIVSAVRPVRG